MATNACPGRIHAANTVAAAGRGHCFDRGSGVQFRFGCDFGLLQVISGPSNDHTVLLETPVDCPLVKLTMWCPGQYNEAAPLYALGAAIPPGPPGQVQANLVSMSSAGEGFLPTCISSFVFKTHIAAEDGSFQPYVVTPPIEATFALDLVFDICVFGCPCETSV